VEFCLFFERDFLVHRNRFFFTEIHKLNKEKEEKEKRMAINDYKTSIQSMRLTTDREQMSYSMADTFTKQNDREKSLTIEIHN